MKNEKPEILTLHERQVACVSYTGNYIGNAQVFGNLFHKLGEWAGPKGMMGPETVFYRLIRMILKQRLRMN